MPDMASCGADQIIENLGQAPPDWGPFYTRGAAASVAFKDGGLMVAFGQGDPLNGLRAPHYSVLFDGARHVSPRGVGPTGTEFNFFLGNDPSRWVSGARGFSGVRYDGLWDGVDLVYRLTGGRLKYDIVVAPGADVSSVRLSYAGVDAMSLDAGTGALSVGVAGGTCTDDAPVSYQEGPLGRTPVVSAFARLGPRTVGFEIGEYDASRPLVIDPTLLFSTFLGGTDDEYPEGCDVGPSGDLYLFGITTSNSFPTTAGAYNMNFNGGWDVFVSRFSNDGTRLLGSTYIGGSEDDNGPYGSNPYIIGFYGGMCLDAGGNVFVTGHTLSGDFPTTAGAYDRTYSSPNYDCFVFKLSPDCSQLSFSTYVGGTQNDDTLDICLDSQGNPIINGYTWGDYPTTSGAFDTTFNGVDDAFVTKLSATGDRLLFSSYAGGTAMDTSLAVAVDSHDFVYLTGYTQCSGFPTTAGAYDTTPNGGWDTYVLKLNETGAKATYSTFVGSTGGDYGLDIVVDDQGRAYVVGFVQATGFPMVSGCYDTTYNGDIDIFLFRMSTDGSALEKSTYLGTNVEDRVYNIALAPSGDVVLGGFSSGTVPTTADAYDTSNNGDYDAFMAQFDPDLKTLVYGSMFGTQYDDKAWGVCVVPIDGMVFMTGITAGSGFPTTSGAYDTTHNGGVDVFVMKLGVLNPPHWLTLPSYSAVEDVPLKVNFSARVADLDTPINRLFITSVSTFVVKTSGLEVTFLFPNGVTAASVPIVLSDGGAQAVGDVNFTITPVNDAPRCTIPPERTAVEDVPLTIDFAPYLSDVDNLTSNLALVVDSPYANATGLNLTVEFPEGVLSYDLFLNVTDGIDATEVLLHFTVAPVDDPPVVAALPLFTATEDKDSVFNITPYLSDTDTAIANLTVLVRDPNCTAVWQNLHFLFKRGGIDVNVSVEVTDAHSRVIAVLRVHVAEVNDAPVVHGVSPKLLTEDRPETLNLSAYIEDEDTPRDRLVLECADPHVVRPIVGFNLTLLFTTWVPEQVIVFSVYDGALRTNGSFDIQVKAVNDPPVILGVGALTAPITIAIDEGSELYLQVRVSDEDSTNFKYTVSSKWSGIAVFLNGSVRLSATAGDIGNYTATLNVDDLGGGNASVPIAIQVRNVNDPPTAPVLVLPQNHTVVEEGANVTFSVDVLDPDTVLGQVLTVTWRSNVSGVIRTMLSNRSLMFVTDDLPVGTHRVWVTVTDGQYVREAWLELTVTAKYVPPPPRPVEPSLLIGTTGIAIIALIIVLVIVGVVLVVVMGRRRTAAEEEEERASAAAAEARPPSEPVTAPITMEGDLRALGASMGDMAAQLEATRAAEARTAAALPAGPAPALEAVPVPVSEEDEADRERTREVREVMRALTQLPQGLPTTLWGWDMNELARTVVDSERRTVPDGTQLVKIKGRWYNVDRTNVGVFMREWKEPEAPAPPRTGPMTADERKRRLEQLETALLDGKISEQTYRELKRKYEGGG